jgi:glycosyltransferase involved in cell wall biosynthesis
MGALNPTSTTAKLAPRRVLIISPDILPHPGMPTVGSGLRAWSLGQGLMSCGHEVLFSMPRDALVGREELAPPGVMDLAWEHDSLAAVVHATEPDSVVVCNWPALASLPTDTLEVPIILDQHGPHYLEREYQKAGDPEENAQLKTSALRKADFFTCAGKKQRAYFQPWLEHAGWTEQERRELTGVVPVSLSPHLPERDPADELTFVYGGVFLPWQDPSVGLQLLVEAMERRGYGKLLFFGGKHPFHRVSTGIFDTLLDQLKKSSHVIASGIVPHETLINEYTRAHVAIDLMNRNPERELAFTTRTVEYLWCGLPVIHNDYAELSDYIREYDAGWTIDPQDREAITATLDEIFKHPEQLAERAQNAQRLVRKQLTWDKTIGPLDAFVRHPQRRPHDVTREQPAAKKRNMGIQHLVGEAWFHYRRGGAATLWKETRAFLRRLTSSSR